MKVGLIGVGAMGTALLSRLRIAGREVQAYDISEDRMAYARSQGAKTVASAAEAARDVECVHIFVRTDDELIDVTMGKNGILKVARPGTMVFLHSTVMPKTSRKIAAAAAKRKVRVLDVPVTAVPRVVAAGDAVFLMGGAEADVEAAKSLLAPLGRGAHYFGAVGSGNVAKIAKNLINANERVALAEVAAIAEAGGIDVKQFFEMAAGVDQGSAVARWQNAFAMEGNHAAPRPASNLLNKDVGLAADLARALRVKAPMTQAAAATAKIWVRGWERAEGKPVGAAKKPRKRARRKG